MGMWLRTAYIAEISLKGEAIMKIVSALAVKSVGKQLMNTDGGGGEDGNL